jgi:formylglycine-generating enzyme required for sulfatase activity
LHDVTITSGFWMFETPCTQQLWLAVMGGENPSRFPDPERPIEQVSWDDANKFAKRLSNQFDELDFRLPTEAQWEYACRAGTKTAIYSGPLEILGDANAPNLDPIAWYRGNSGHEFDHDQPEDLSAFGEEQRQYEFKAAGTRRVKQKRPNPWGLYDMLGNVWEWCQDWHADYDLNSLVDPVGPEEGSSRVIRGGSWIDGAQGARSACRIWRVPGLRWYFLGFRCMSSVKQQQAERESASTSEPRDEAAEKRRTK